MVSIRETDSLQDRRKERPIIDISYVELPDRVTHRINAGSIMGAAAFLDLFVFIPGTVENNPLLTVALVLLFGICAYLAIREEGKNGD